MQEQQINLRRQPLPSARRSPGDQFRYSGIIVAIAAVAALTMAMMMRSSADDGQSAAVAELGETN